MAPIGMATASPRAPGQIADHGRRSFMAEHQRAGRQRVSARRRAVRLWSETLSTLDLLVAGHHCFRAPWQRRDPLVSAPKGNSSIGRASVSKTEGCGFKSLLPCSAHLECRGKVNVADKDEVEPTDESSAPDPSSPDAAPTPRRTPSPTAARTSVSDEPEAAVEGDFAPETEADWPRTTSRSTPTDRAGRPTTPTRRRVRRDRPQHRRRGPTDPDAEPATATARSWSRPVSARRPRARQSGNAARPGPQGHPDRQARPAGQAGADDAGQVRPPVGRRAAQGRLSDRSAADQLLRRRAGVRAVHDRVREPARPRLRRGDLQDLRLMTTNPPPNQQ